MFISSKGMTRVSVYAGPLVGIGLSAALVALAWAIDSLTRSTQ
jgi:hypothetical protein